MPKDPRTRVDPFRVVKPLMTIIITLINAGLPKLVILGSPDLLHVIIFFVFKINVTDTDNKVQQFVHGEKRILLMGLYIEK